MTLSVIRKLTYHSPALQSTFAERGGIRLVIELSSSPEFISSSSSYSTAARDQLVGLTLGKKFICHAAASPKHLHDHVLKAFPALSPSLGLSSLYPSYVVDLVTMEGEWVADGLVASQHVWPCHAPFPKGVEPVWTCVSVTCVEDGGHIWCQFCLDKPKPRIDAMATVLRELAPPTDGDCRGSTFIPAVGELCLAYFDPRTCHAPSCIDEPTWGRGRLLCMERGTSLSILSIDYGVTGTLPPSHILPLPPQCKGIPPLAIPCKLLGVAPVPVCTVVQENAAAILRNLAFEKTAFRREIIAFGGVEALLKLSLSCDVGVAEQSTAALLNMAITDEEKEEMGQRGAVETLLALVLQSPSHPSLLPLSLGTLYTLTTRNHRNLKRLIRQQAHSKLSAMLTRDSLQERDREMLSAILKMLNPSPSIHRPRNSSVPAGGGRVRGQGPQSSREPRRTLSTTSPTKRATREEERRQQIQGSKERGSGTMDVVYRCLGDREFSGDVMSEDEEEGKGEGGISGGVVANQSYIYNSVFSFEEDDEHAFVDVDSVKQVTRALLQRTICAMMNSGRRCTIYVGVSHRGRVRGVQADWKERDILGMVIDGIMHNGISPSIKHHQYKVLFVPVVSGSRSSQAPRQTYVLQLEMQGGGASRKEVYTVVSVRDRDKTEQCFSRCGRTNVQTSPQELRNMLARQESNCHGNEVSSLLQNISTLRATLDMITMTTTTD